VFDLHMLLVSSRADSLPALSTNFASQFCLHPSCFSSILCKKSAVFLYVRQGSMRIATVPLRIDDSYSPEATKQQRRKQLWMIRIILMLVVRAAGGRRKEKRASS
jgi:hypothetical protein